MTAMTAIYEPARAVRTPSMTAPAEAAHDALAARQEALHALDSFVRPLLIERLLPPFAFRAPTVELTVYDQVFRRTHAGGHWTVSSRRTGLLTHTIASFSVALHFDADDRASHFVIEGARTVVTEDAAPESLAAGLDDAARGGPLLTWGSNFMPGISL